MNLKDRPRLNLQLFAEDGQGDGAGADAGNSGGSEAKGPESKPTSFDDFLKGEGNQAEFDRRVQKAVNTAVTNAQAKWKALTDDQLSEAEKLAKMNKDEKAQYMQQKREKELADREAAVTKKELMAEAKNTLAEKGLPAALAELLSFTDADACSKSIETVEKAFRAAVQSGVEEKLKGSSTMKKAPEDSDAMAKQVEALIMGR